MCNTMYTKEKFRQGVVIRNSAGKKSSSGNDLLIHNVEEARQWPDPSKLIR